jgi:hypothetical protein
MTAERHPDLMACLRTALLRDGGHYTVADVMQALQRGEAQIITSDANDAFVLTEVLSFPRHRALRIWVAGGRLQSLLELVPQVDELAREEGCAELLALGRPGWLRMAERHGWSPQSLLFRRAVPQEANDGQ